MLTGGINILETPCQDVNRSVPYFKELDRKEGRSNEVVYQRFGKLSEQAISVTLKHISAAGLKDIPDGIL